MRSSNPALKESTFLDLASGAVVSRDAGTMTINGTMNKTAILLLLCVVTAAFSWNLALTPDKLALTPLGTMLWIGGAISGFIMAMITIFKTTWAPVTAPIYAVLQGVFLGAISAYFNARYPGIVVQAIMLTFGTMLAMLLAYRSGLIKVTGKFKMGVIAATGGIVFLYLGVFVANLFGANLTFLRDSTKLSIAISLFVVVIAALNLALDFDFIESASEHGVPKYMEWYGAFGLMVTLVWLYIEFLRLLSKLRD